MQHLERIKLVLRARYFLDSWEALLAACGYRKDRYFISREAADILRFIIDGFIALVIIHRDHVPWQVPLLPWLHSSEACEHVFGEARHIVKDFTFLDFIYMIPKLRIKLHKAVLRGKSSDPKTHASGYSHSYFDHEGLDLLALSTYPSDADIELASQSAAEEANSLMALLGVNPDSLHNLQASNTWLPGVKSWLKDPITSDFEDSDRGSDSDFSDDEESEAQKLQCLLDEEESSSIMHVRRVDEHCLNLTSAALALAADEAAIVFIYIFLTPFTRITTTIYRQQFTVIDDDELEEVVSDKYTRIQDVSRLHDISIPAVQLADDPSRPLGHNAMQHGDLDFEMLITMRRQHQTKQAATGVRTRKFKADSSQSETTMHGKIIHKLHEMLKEAQDDIGIGTGADRGQRWTDNRVPAPRG